MLVVPAKKVDKNHETSIHHYSVDVFYFSTCLFWVYYIDVEVLHINMGLCRIQWFGIMLQNPPGAQGPRGLRDFALQNPAR